MLLNTYRTLLLYLNIAMPLLSYTIYKAYGGALVLHSFWQSSPLTAIPPLPLLHREVEEGAHTVLTPVRGFFTIARGALESTSDPLGPLKGC